MFYKHQHPHYPGVTNHPSYKSTNTITHITLVSPTIHHTSLQTPSPTLPWCHQPSIIPVYKHQHQRYPGITNHPPYKSTNTSTHITLVSTTVHHTSLQTPAPTLPWCHQPSTIQVYKHQHQRYPGVTNHPPYKSTNTSIHITLVSPTIHHTSLQTPTPTLPWCHQPSIIPVYKHQHPHYPGVTNHPSYQSTNTSTNVTLVSPTIHHTSLQTPAPTLPWCHQPSTIQVNKHHHPHYHGDTNHPPYKSTNTNTHITLVSPTIHHTSLQTPASTLPWYHQPSTIQVYKHQHLHYHGITNHPPYKSTNTNTYITMVLPTIHIQVHKHHHPHYHGVTNHPSYKSTNTIIHITMVIPTIHHTSLQTPSSTLPWYHQPSTIQVYKHQHPHYHGVTNHPSYKSTNTIIHITLVSPNIHHTSLQTPAPTLHWYHQLSVIQIYKHQHPHYPGVTNHPS